MLDHPLADDGALAGDDVDHALRDPGVEDELAEPQSRERRQLGRLQHDRVPAGESRAELPAGDVEREVPGHDQADDAERLPEGQVDSAGDRDRLSVVLVDRARVEVEDLGHHADLAARAGDRLAHVGRLDRGELLARRLLDEFATSREQARRDRHGATFRQAGKAAFARATAASVSSTPGSGSSRIVSSVAGLRTVITGAPPGSASPRRRAPGRAPRPRPPRDARGRRARSAEPGPRSPRPCRRSARAASRRPSPRRP